MSVAQVLLERLKRNMAAGPETPTRPVSDKKSLTDKPTEKVLKIGALMKQASTHYDEAESLPAPNRWGKSLAESKESGLKPVEQIANLVECLPENGEMTPPRKSEEPQTPAKASVSPAMLESI